MNLTPYVEMLRQELAATADTEEARALAARLAGPLESTARLALLNALSDAMAEITRDLAPGAVDVRLRGLDPEFVVTPPPTQDPPEAAQNQPAPMASDAEDGATARINLRLPAHLKTRVEEAAHQEGQSVNSWLVRAVTAALEPEHHPRHSHRGRRQQGFTGWVH
ncbi:MAG: Arc family DNA-binding protein [Corynebacteriales bacterium]|nr:Arc family DNA-binding protein [Mycobacteriales bacterium]